ncbi:MAG TPA: acetyl-CoA decarbonylase/synthase complex subunit gamma [Nitrospiria bacterium]|nr:acetyl-CoA decarbonylase/synthase complex subunit gamma [Nitrospiria bacterium]
MALSGVEIFKHLPKTNCKECGHPTCLAFAMKLAAKQANLDSCPYVSKEGKEFLSSASAPPIRPICIGHGDGSVKLGEETVLFRHEKKFVNPCALALSIDDSLPDTEILKRIDEVKTSEIERVGQKLRVEVISVGHTSSDPSRFSAAVKLIRDNAPKIPLILNSKDPAAIESALPHCKGARPVIYAATKDNAEAMVKLAKENSAILGVYAEGLDALSSLTEKIKGMGLDDLVIDPGASTPRRMIEDYTMIRRSAIKKNFKPLGYPIIAFTSSKDVFAESMKASIGIAKYASIIVLDSIERWKMLPLITLRQNIYTDPQVPMQVAQKIYKIGDADEKSPLLLTTNFSLTYFIVQGEVENSKVPCWLAIMDVDGLSVLTAWAAGKFTAPKIASFILESGIGDKVAHKELIIPGYVSILSGALEEKLNSDWKVIVGPREANAIPAFLKNRAA